VEARALEERRTQAERSEATTEQLVAAARKLFATKGFAATSIDDIVGAAGVTRGAMYHHFRSKEDLFEEVFKREHLAVGDRVKEAAMKKKDGWSQLKAGCDEFLEATTDPERRQIMMLDAPAVLGMRRIEEIDRPDSIKLMTGVIEKAMDEGIIRRRQAEPLAHLIYGALCQAALVGARSTAAETGPDQMRRELDQLLDALGKTG
jgi:AcrR family transcriptional regulator